MSGTPVQNSLKDLESLIKFLRVPRLDNSSTFRKFIAGPKIKGTTVRRPVYQNLDLLRESICIRRDKALLSLVPETSLEHHPHFSEVEMKEYNKLSSMFRKLNNASISRPQTKGRTQPYLTAILMLRMFCNTGVASTMTLETFATHCLPDEAISLLEQNGEAVCMECSADITSLAATSSKHGNRVLSQLLCGECMPQASVSGVSEITRNIDSRRDAHDTESTKWPPEEDTRRLLVGNPTDTVDKLSHQSYPSKLLALFADIKEHYFKDKRSEVSSAAISQC